MDEVSHLKSAGIDFGAPQVNIDTLRGHKEKVIAKLTGGLAQIVTRFLPTVPVISQAEIPPDIRLQSVGVVSAE